MTKKELVKFLFDNCYDKHTNKIDLSFLDFRKYNCGVDLQEMKVNGNLLQNGQKARYINQGGCEAETIYQARNKADFINQCFPNAKLLQMDSLKCYIKKEYADNIITYERKKKMTQKEIEKILGFEIEIIEGELNND